MGNPARVAFFDIENAPSLGYYYDPWKEGNIVATLEPWFMLSFAWQELGSKTVQCKVLCDYPSYKNNKKDDSHLVKDLWTLFDNFDVLIAHNGDRFDKRKANARFLGLGLRPPSPYKTIDTLKIARRAFMLESNKLSSLGEFLGLGGKLPTTGWATWRGCIEGDPKSWALMKRYNRHDVLLLSQIYDRLKAWAPSHPDLRVYSGATGCPTCTSPNVQHRGFNVARSRRTQRMHCQACGSWFSGAPV
jgi:hypothetical protein